MQSIKSQTTEQKSTFVAKVIFQNSSGEDLTLSDSNIIDLNTAKIKANALLLQKGSEITQIDFTIPYHGLELADVIKLSAPNYPIPKYKNKDRFIVQSVRVKITANQILEDVKAIRYD